MSHNALLVCRPSVWACVGLHRSTLYDCCVSTWRCCFHQLGTLLKRPICFSSLERMPAALCSSFTHVAAAQQQCNPTLLLTSPVRPPARRSSASSTVTRKSWWGEWERSAASQTVWVAIYIDHLWEPKKSKSKPRSLLQKSIKIDRFYKKYNRTNTIRNLTV